MAKQRPPDPARASESTALAQPKTHPERRKQRALTAFLKTRNVSGACAAAQVGRSTWYEWIQNDELFARLAGEINQAITEELEAEMYRRATKKTGASDTLLIFALKARDPDKYRDRKVITEISPEVRFRVQQTQQIIASQPMWDSEELLVKLNEVWK